jgi:cobalt-zinc-cadmium efflux system outer membrane protein
MRRGWSRQPIGAVLALTLSGCAGYRSAPLDPVADETLRGPALAAMVAPAASFQHPGPKPVALDAGRPLTPDALAIIAVLANPDLKAARAKAQVATAQVFQAGLLPDPSVNLGYDFRLAGPDPQNGWAAALAYELTALRDRGVEAASAKAAERQVRLDLAWQEWQTAEQAKLLAVRIAGLETAERMDAETKTEADLALSRVLQAASRGDLKADEVETRRLAALEASDKLAQARKDLGGARLDLNKLLGLPPRAELSIAFAAPSPTPAETAEALFNQARTQRLDLKALRAGYESQNAEVRKAIYDQFPSFQLTINRAKDTAGTQTVGPAINFTLPLWNRNRGGIRIAEATREQLRAEYAARVFAARADIAELVETLALAQRQRAETEGQIAPILHVADATAAAAARGDVAQAAADTARQTLRDKQAALAALDQSIAEQTISLELATGGPLS